MSELRLFWWLLSHIYSSDFAKQGRRDVRDPLIGHGLDILPSVRVVFAIGLITLIGLGVNFIISPHFFAAVAFIALYMTFAWYIRHLPECGLTELRPLILDKSDRQGFRSYFGGRVLFTPYGVSFSIRRCKLVFVTNSKQSKPNSVQNLTEANTASAASASTANYFSASSTNATTAASTTNITNEPLIIQIKTYLKKLWQPPAIVEINLAPWFYKISGEQKGCCWYLSRFLTKPFVPSLTRQAIYPGAPLSLNQLHDLTKAELTELTDKSYIPLTEKDLVFLGFGFPWIPKHTRRLYEQKAIGLTPSIQGLKGSPDIHSVEDHNLINPIFLTRNLLEGHTMLLGTTGSGKTRFFDLLVSQAIERGDAVIILDPKGDRDLQQNILRAMRFSKRDPINELFCLDIGRKVGPSFTTYQAEDYSNLSHGKQSDWVDFRLGVSKNYKNYPLDNLVNRNEFTEDRFKEGSELDHTSIKANPDDYFFEVMNKGLNPTSAFNRSSEIAERICAMMSDVGSAASFKAYAQMAVSAAVDCLIITRQKVSLENIRSIIGNHRSFLDTFRFFLVQIVTDLKLTKVSTYFNRIHGVTVPQLQVFYATVPLLIGDHANLNASRRKELNLLKTLTENKVITSSEESEQLLNEAEQSIDIPEIKEEDQEESTTTTTKSKRTSRTKKSTSGVHPASLNDLIDFYKWLINKGYIRNNDNVEHILSMSSLSSDYYRKVTTGIMPFLSALTAGNLADLLSDHNNHLPTLFDLIKECKVVYIALQCLKDASTGQALGKLMMSDLAFVAGEINLRQHEKFPKVSIFIDESSELSNEALVQLLNKSRSSNFSLTLATQSVADLSKRTGSKESAQQIIANCNNLIALRINDYESKEVLEKVIPSTVTANRSSSTMSSENGGYINDSYMTSRSLQQRDAPLFPTDCLTLLPDFEFVARFASGEMYKGFIPYLTKQQQSINTEQTTQEAQLSSAQEEIPNELNAQAQANLDTEEFYHKSSDYDPEFDAVSNMLDLGFQLCTEQSVLDEQRPDLLTKMADKRSNKAYRLYAVQRPK